MSDELTHIIGNEIIRSCHPAIGAITRSVLDQRSNGVVAVIAYGSCLRGLDPADGVIDLYLLVSRYRDYHRSWLSAGLNRLVPPNVYFHQSEFGGRPIRAKYAVVSLKQFEARMRPGVGNPYFWGRFSQPSALLFANSEETRDRVVAALRQAVRTTLANAVQLCGEAARGEDLWRAVLRASYSTELRAEDETRAEALISSEGRYYRTVTRAAFASAEPLTPVPASRAQVDPLWRRRRFYGIVLSLLRLAKAAFTFQGGADYIAWKVKRHSGVEIKPTAWQRRHPLLAAIVLLPRLYRAGGIR